jgi:hypothetical protein
MIVKCFTCFASLTKHIPTHRPVTASHCVFEKAIRCGSSGRCNSGHPEDTFSVSSLSGFRERQKLLSLLAVFLCRMLIVLTEGAIARSSASALRSWLVSRRPLIHLELTRVLNSRRAWHCLLRYEQFGQFCSDFWTRSIAASC